MNYIKLNRKLIFLPLILLFTVITAGIDLYTYSDISRNGIYIQRPFGNEIKLNFLWIIILAYFLFFSSQKIKILSRDNYKVFFIFVLLSIFFPNRKEKVLWFIGALQIIKYYLIYRIILKTYNFKSFNLILRKVLIFLLYLETVTGISQVFFGINIPFISSRHIDAYRNGLLRMCGTFSYASEMALFISIILVYFVVDFLIKKDKKVIKYIVLCLIDLWLTGSRTMIVICMIAIIMLVWKRNKGKPIPRIAIIIGAIGFCVLFFRSDIFYKLFIQNNIFFMLSTRMVHWRIGLETVKNNFLFGVGLNNSVDYAIANEGMVREAYIRSIEPISFYFTNPIHNSFLILTAELGIIGGILYASLYVRMISFLFKKSNNKDTKCACLFVGASGIVLLVYALQGWGIVKELGWILITVILAFSKITVKEMKKQEVIYCEKNIHSWRNVWKT